MATSKDQLTDESSEKEQESAPTTAGQAEGSTTPEAQSQTSPAPTQPDLAEGAADIPTESQPL